MVNGPQTGPLTINISITQYQSCMNITVIYNGSVSLFENLHRKPVTYSRSLSLILSEYTKLSQRPSHPTHGSSHALAAITSSPSPSLGPFENSSSPPPSEG